MQNRYGFLYRKISLPYAITEILLNVPEFYDAVEAAVSKSETIDDKWVFDVVQGIYRDKVIARQSQKTMTFPFRGIRKGLRILAEKLTGDANLWCDGFSDILPTKNTNKAVPIPEGNEDVGYLIDICSGLSHKTRKTIVSDAIIVKAFRKHGEVSSLQEAYEVFKIVFFKAVRRNDKNSNDKRVVSRYWKWRSIVKEFSTILYGDENYWHQDLSEFLNTSE